MKKQLNQGVVIGILVVVGIIVAAWGWKALAPPGPEGVKTFDKATVKVIEQKHAQSATDMANEQARLYKQAHGGGQ
jgi:hypothetical protein